MKRKLLFAMLCIVSALGLRAQEDITSTYLTNADLSTVDNGWTYYSDAYKYQAWRNTNDDGHVPAVEFYAGWGSLEHTNFKFSQTITLPAGDYRIAVNAFYREGNGGDGTNNDKAWIFAGDIKQNVYALNGMSAVSAYDGGGDDMDDAMRAFKAGAFSNAFDFSLAEETTITLGFEGVFTQMRSWCILGPVKLYKYSLDDYLTDYDSKYAEAQALTGKPMNADVQSALTAAMVDRNSFSLVSEVTAAIQTLNAAVNNATTSIANYAAIKAVMDENTTKLAKLDSYGSEAYATAAATALNAYNNGTATDGATEIAALKAAYKTALLATKQPADGTDMTPYITNADFDSGNTDGWTIEVPLGGNHGIQGGSRMEYWAGNASNRAEASFNYYQELSNLPAGVYTVSADMYNSLNGEGGDYTVFSPTCGVYGVSSNEEVALVDTDGEVLKSYTTGNIFVFRGKMTIGTKNTVTPMAARWFVFDNVKLTYVRQLTQEEIDANTLPESISLDVTSAALTIYGTQTLTATILPDNANDKTITWTSSNEKVATVSNGVVTAVGVGTATITATANGADDVETTATVTVTDVTPAAAPAFYSTEIASGTDYYIVNAATGTFLGGANSWGTQASLIEHGIPFGANTVSEGVYTLDSYTYNDANNHFVNGTFVDGVATNLYIKSVGEGKFTISTADGSAFMTAKPGTTVVDNTASNSSSVLSQWYFLSKADRDKMLAGATAENPADATYYVKQANISRNRSAGGFNVNAWSQYSVGGTQDNANFAAQVYNEAVDNYQTIENIPNGTYVVAVQAFTSGTGVKFYANDAKVDVLAKPDGVATPSAAAALFAQKQYTNTVNVTVTNNTLKIGFEGDCSSAKWLCYDDVTLYMTSYYDASATMEITDALYATFVAPFDVTIPEGVTAYTVDGVESNGTTLTMTEVTTTIPANTPVVLSAEAAVAAQTFAGKSVAGEAKAGLLTGVYEATPAPAGSYVLQNNEDKVGFYVVGSTIPTVRANRAYLTVPSTGVKAFFFDNATAIQGVEAEKENGAIFNLAGQRVNKAQKGIYIVNGKKVMVK